MRIIRGLIPVLMAVIMFFAILWLANSCSKMPIPEKLEYQQQALMLIAGNCQFAKQASRATLTNAGKYAEPGSSSYWLYVEKACGNNASNYDGVTSCGKVALYGMVKLANKFADGAKSEELLRLISREDAQVMLMHAFMIGGVFGERDWGRTAESLSKLSENYPAGEIKESIRKAISSILDFIRERYRIFAKAPG